jgi:mannose-6-phosphate isomerase-like protein (cupin superfamily)
MAKEQKTTAIRPTILQKGEGKTTVNVLDDIITIKIAGEQTDGMFSLLEVSVPPQNGPPLHIHNREVESYYILEGDFEITVGNNDSRTVVKASAGTFVSVPKGIPNTYKNVGNKEGRFLMFYSPANASKAFEEVGQPDSSTTPPDMDKMMSVMNKYGMEIVAAK